jgi:choline dehydrogenase-like flavoprotein
MHDVVVVGSGASAVHFALSALEKGRSVLMVDVGRERPAPVLPDASLVELKERLDDPVAYFLGDTFESVLYPGARGEYYGFPPSKQYVFLGVPQFSIRARGFSPLASFASGGLAEAWTGGVYPFNDAELSQFPFGYTEIAPYYDLIARRIGISGEVDDLSRFMPVHQHLMPPLDLDEHSRVLLDAYARHRTRLNERLRCYVGRSRIATLSRDLDGRRACSYRGRCLWGCPSKSLYTPSATLEACERFDRFTRVTGAYVKYFKVDDGQRVTAIVLESTVTGAVQEIAVSTLALGAGTLSSCRIFLESIYRATGERVTLGGLMDNQQVLMPFVNLAMLGRRYDPNTYQYHQVGMGFEGAQPDEYIHAQVTTLKTALIHPIVQNLPFDLKTSLAIFGNVHAALGLVNINLHDSRREENRVMFEPADGEASGRLIIEYDGHRHADRVRSAMQRTKKALRALKCLVPPGMTHVRPMGASVHYSGLVPMTDRPERWTASPNGRSRDIENLLFVDGTTFPFLPAKNLTFTLMANAARIADAAL